MTTDQRHSLDELKAAISELLTATDRLALCLDFDGTLAPIVDDPAAAEMPDETRAHVQTLAEHPAVDVAIISGRALEDIRSRTGIDGISYAGNHGLELQQGEEVWVHPDVETHRPALEKSLDRIRQDLSDVPGTSVEDKHASATIHYRRATTDDSSFVIAAVEDIVENEDGLTMAVDNQTVEIRQDIDQRKGEEVTELGDIESGVGIV
jgi:trehalose 6-phosphate phosphatase